MILLGKTKTAKLNEIKAEIQKQAKRKDLHSRAAQNARDELLALIPEDKRDEALNHIGEFANRLRHLEMAREAIFNLGEQQRKLDVKRPQWRVK